MADARRLIITAYVLLDPIPVSRARQRPYLFGSICGEVVLVSMNSNTNFTSATININNVIFIFLRLVLFSSRLWNTMWVSLRSKTKAFPVVGITG